MNRLLLGLSILCFMRAPAQDYMGYVNSNYAGITSAVLNPANIADSRLRVDVSLWGMSVNAANNYIGVKRAAFDHNYGLIKSIRQAIKGDTNAFPAFNDKNFQNNYLVSINNGKPKSIYSSFRLSLPSVMVTINQRNAIGVSLTVREYTNVDGIGEDLARLAYADFGRSKDQVVNDLLGKEITNDKMSANAMMWMEYGVTWAHVFRDKDEHFFKGGITPKLLQGLAAAYINVEKLNYRFDNDINKIVNDSALLAVIHTTVNYGHSANLEFPTPGAPNRISNPLANDPTLYNTFNGWPKFASKPGFGLDLGAVYEWRPHYQKYKYDMDGKKDLWRRDQNKYKLKVGLSVLDIGGITFPKGKYSSDFAINVDSIQYRKLHTGNYPIYDFDKILDSLATFYQTPSTFKMALPTALSMQVDYNIWKDFYVNLTPYIAFQHKNKITRVHDMTVVSLAPRWDHKWFGVSVPVSYNSFYAKAKQPIKVGACIRLGPLTLGTNDLASYTAGDVFGANFYFLFKVPVPYAHVKDRDKDGISNKKDLCKDVPGVWEFKGCPDRDGDHVQDSEDKCPDAAGLKELQGCPDKDADGITDLEDMCPDSAGTAEFKGCPDRDNDRIIDREDKCPDAAGLAEFNGCPDKDGDGTQDSEDACPEIFGPKEYKGCPDKDGDKVLDKEDECPEQAGPVENKGCPWPDTDKDGIIDRLDSCITVPGIAQYKGCPPPPPTPPMKAAEKKIIERAFANLEFATAKDIIKAKSFPSLDALAKLLKTHEADWKLKLSGHTDNEGTAEKNMVLSEKRANAVKNYLVKKGVSSDQILTEWFGQERPIADNATPKGRQKNRRVEMTIITRE